MLLIKRSRIHDRAIRARDELDSEMVAVHELEEREAERRAVRPADVVRVGGFVA